MVPVMIIPILYRSKRVENVPQYQAVLVTKLTRLVVQRHIILNFSTLKLYTCLLKLIY